MNRKISGREFKEAYARGYYRVRYYVSIGNKLKESNRVKIFNKLAILDFAF